MSDKVMPALLLVEDEECRAIAKEILEEQKFRVVTATTGNEARLKFSNEIFGMVILDMDIKNFKVLDFVENIRRKEELKSVRDRVPILVVGKKADGFTEKLSQIDHVRFQALPYTGIEFKKRLAKFLNNSAAFNNNTKIIPAGEYLITEGGTSNEMYWVIDGRFTITKLNQDEKNVIIGEIKPGELVGEMSFLDNLPRSASVKAEVESEVLAIPHSKFIDVLDGQPRWFKSLMQTLSGRLRTANTMIARKVVESAD